MQENKRLRVVTLVIICGASFMVPFLTYALNLATPDIGETFKASASSLSWVAASFLISSAVFSLPFGRLADITGLKKLFNLGLLLSAIMSFICAVAWTVEWLIFFRVIQGIVAAMVFSTAAAILTSVYPPQERGKVLGINSATVYLGLSLGSSIGGFLTYIWGWASIFIVIGILHTILYIMSVTLMKGEWAGTPGKKYDWRGAILYIAGLTAFMCGLSSLNEHWIFVLVTLAGLALLVILIKYDTSSDHPLLPVQMIRQNKAYSYASCATLINYSANFATVFLLSLYLQSVLKFDARIAGVLLLSQPIIMAILSPFTGRLSDRVDPRKVSSLGMFISMLSLFFFSLFGLETPTYLVLMNLLFGGIGFALFASPNSNAVMSSVDKSLYGLASSTLASVRMIGQSTSMALASLFLRYYVGSVQLSLAPVDRLLAAIKIAFAVFGALSILGVIAASRKTTKPV